MPDMSLPTADLALTSKADRAAAAARRTRWKKIADDRITELHYERTARLRAEDERDLAERNHRLAEIRVEGLRIANYALLTGLVVVACGFAALGYQLWRR